MSMRQILATGLHLASLYSGDGLRRAKAQRAPRVLMYHGIGEGGVSARLFAWQLDFLRNEFELMSLRELLNRRAQGALTGHEVALTFDDGVRNHATTVYPLLCAHKAPATFFVCPGLMDSGQWIWNTELRCRLRLLSTEERAPLAALIGSADSGIETLVAQAKSLDLARRREAEAWVRERTTRFAATPQQTDQYAPMSWEQLLGLDPELVTIGSHTLNHPILPTLSADGMREEIDASRRVLEQRLGRQVELFCYPNGDNDARVHALVRSHYDAAVTTVPGAVGGHDDACLLPRIPAGETRGLFVRRLHRHAA